MVLTPGEQPIYRGMGINNLDKLLDPCHPEEFLASSWGRTYKYVPGQPGKFSHLLPWAQLNNILRQHRLDFPRLRLVQGGRSLPSSSYIRHVLSGRRKVQVPRVLPAELTAQLRRGATLVLDAVDELYDALEELAEGLERYFHEHVQINAYAGWRTSRGFDLHWDDHDVFILQVTGRKRWSVYGMTRPYPLVQDVESSPKPQHEPLWEETLKDGDLLYIPRGWWHVAIPMDEPTLHLTVGIHNRTGIDLLHWSADRMRSSETFRMDLPRFASGMERENHLERLRNELLSEWGADLLDRYEKESDVMAQSRPHFNLPWSAMLEALPPANDTLVRLTAPRPLDLKINSQHHDGKVVEFSCHGKRWRFAEDAIIILQLLADGHVHSVSDLCHVAKGKVEEQTVRTFLGELILHGLLAVVNK